MIHKEFTLTNFPMVTSNSLARVFMLFEFFGLRFLHICLIASSAEKMIDAINFDQLFRLCYLIMTNLSTIIVFILIILISTLRGSGSSISH